MMFRAVVCCAALIIGLLAALNVTAQSAGACNGGSCGSAQPLNLMNFMNGSGKASAAKPAAAAPAKTAATKHRHPAKTAARSGSDVEPPAVSAAAASAYAEHSYNDVQVVSGEEVNAIDRAMGNANAPAAETNGVASGNRESVKWADANEFRAEQYKPASAPAPASEPITTFRDDSWMGRFWSMIGDGYLALMAMIKQLFS